MEKQHHADQDEEGLYDDRAALVRWPRLGAALTFILLAVVLIVIENRAGIVPGLSPRASGTAASAFPALGSQISNGGLVILPKFISRQTTAGTLAAAPHSHLVLVAIRIVNSGQTAESISAAAFSIRQENAAIAAAIPYPGHPDRLTNAKLMPHVAAVGVLVFQVRDGLHDLALAYIPRDKAISAARWSLP